MSISEVNSVLQRIHESRAAQSRIRLFVGQLTRQRQLQNPTAKAMQVVAESASSSPELFLSDVLDSIEDLLVEPRRNAARQKDSSANHDMGVLRDLSEDLRLKHDISARAERQLSSREHSAKLKDVNGSDLVSLLGLVFLVSRTVEADLEAVIAAHCTTLDAILKKMSVTTTVTTSSNASVLARINAQDVEQARLLSTPHHSFVESGPRNLLVHVLATKSWLTFIDLSDCLLGDTIFTSEVAPCVSRMQHLVGLAVPGNDLTDAASSLLLSCLETAVSESDDVVLTFPCLRALNVNRNQLSVAVRTLLEDAVRRRAAGLSSEAYVLRALHCTAPTMHAAALVKSLTQFAVDADFTSGRDAFDVISGDSFGCIVAAALLLKCTPAALDRCFGRLCDEVFSTNHYGFYAVAAARSLRHWWTGGDYYSADAFKAIVEELIGRDNANLTLMQLEQTFGKRVLLLARHNVAEEEAPVAFRSWVASDASWLVPDATGVLNGSRSVTLIEAIMACCATPGMFAARRLLGSKNAVADIVGGRPDLAALEVLLCVTKGSLQFSVFTPASTTSIGGALIDPSLHRVIATELKRSAVERSMGTMRSQQWHAAEVATMMWSDVTLQCAMQQVTHFSHPVSPLTLKHLSALKGTSSHLITGISLSEGRVDALQSLEPHVSPPW